MVLYCVLDVLLEPDLFLIIIKLGLTIEDVFNLYEAFEEKPDKELIEGLNILIDKSVLNIMQFKKYDNYRN